MLILQRMAMATSSSFLSIPLLKTSSLLSPVKHCASSLISTSSAMATEAQISTQDDKLKDAQMEVADKPEKVVLPTNESSESLITIRHTLFPDAKVTIGPWIENGFYYDFDMEPLTDKELKRIKKEKDRIIGRNLPLIREEVSRDEAHKRITALNEPYKLEILDSIKEDPVTIYHIGKGFTIFRLNIVMNGGTYVHGPMLKKTGNINRKVVELESIAGAYWRGDEKKPMLQRIYGTAWETKCRDHRRLGQVLDLFSIQNDAGGGLVFWHLKGAIVRHVMEDLWKKIHIERGYDLLYTPHVAKVNLWQISGHLDYYKENVYDQMNVEDELYQLRPMNCPFNILLGAVYRYKLSGNLHGLFRVRGFTQVWMMPHILSRRSDQRCIRGVLDLTEELLLQFGFIKYEVNLSTRPEKAVGDDDLWDALGRKWQCSTIQ
ncbi:threonine--tRNA ligase, partial [Pyrus ussuriensis x Pyrus communis]